MGGGIGYQLNPLVAGGFGFRALIDAPTDIYGETMSTTYTLTQALFFGAEIQILNTFGDVFPVQIWSRIWMSVYVMLTLIIMSQKFAELFQEYQEMNDYRYRHEFSKHVVLMGKLNVNSVWRILNEFLYYFETYEKKLEIPQILIIEDK